METMNLGAKGLICNDTVKPLSKAVLYAGGGYRAHCRWTARGQLISRERADQVKAGRKKDSQERLSEVSASGCIKRKATTKERQPMQGASILF